MVPAQPMALTKLDLYEKYIKYTQAFGTKASTYTSKVFRNRQTPFREGHDGRLVRNANQYFVVLAVEGIVVLGGTVV